MNRILSTLGCALFAYGAAYASPITFAGTLSGAAEGTLSTGTGTAIVTYDSATHMLNVNVVFSGLESPTTAAHIHCCIAPPGTAGVATTVPTFAGFPLGVTSGTYVNTLDLTLTSSWNPDFVTAEGGTLAEAEAALATGLESDMTYLNIHTTAFPNGEIRAFLVAVPEPGSVTLALAGLAGLILVKRVRRGLLRKAA